MEIRGNGNEGDKCCLCRLKFECSYANGNGPIVPMIMIKKCLSLKIIMIMALVIVAVTNADVEFKCGKNVRKTQCKYSYLSCVCHVMMVIAINL